MFELPLLQVGLGWDINASQFRERRYMYQYACSILWYIERIFTFFRWIPKIFHRVCLKHQNFHECEAWVKILMFWPLKMKFFGIYRKKVNFLFILYVTLAMYCNCTGDCKCGLEPIHYYHMTTGWRKQRNSSNIVEVLIIVNHEIWSTHQFKIN